MTESARFEVLSAEIRILQVGNGQITRSMYRQLDEVSIERFEAFGRVKDNEPKSGDNKLKSGERVLQLVGRDTKTGALVRYDARPPAWPVSNGPSEFAHWLLHTGKHIWPPEYPVAESPDGCRVVWTGMSKTHCPNRVGWHVSQKRPPGLSIAESSERPKRQGKELCTVDLMQLEQTWRARAKAQLAEMLEEQARYDEFVALPLIVFPD
jgi:hypothetical protein